MQVDLRSFVRKVWSSGELGIRKRGDKETRKSLPPPPPFPFPFLTIFSQTETLVRRKQRDGKAKKRPELAARPQKL